MFGRPRDHRRTERSGTFCGRRATHESVSKTSQEQCQADTHQVCEATGDETAEGKGRVQDTVCNIHKLDVLRTSGALTSQPGFTWTPKTRTK